MAPHRRSPQAVGCSMTRICIFGAGAIGALIGGIKQNQEYQTLLLVQPKYPDLAGKFTCLRPDTAAVRYQIWDVTVV